MYGKLFSLEEEIFQVLANEKRLEILQLLRSGDRNVSEMLEMLGLRQANLSQHLSLLKKSGLLTSVKRGREVYYRLSDNHITDALDNIHAFVSNRYEFQTPSDSAFPFVIDSICGMRLSAADAYGSLESGGETYYFCASGCLEQFKKTI